MGVARGNADDGLPLPPPYLRMLTAGAPDADVFLSLGRAAAEEVARLARSHGAPDGPTLEFGVGCGRVARHLSPLRPGEFYGCDIDPRLLTWSARNLPGQYALTRVDPPLPYANATFALIYALSVFTHLHEPLVRGWLAELGRVTAPGGLAALSFHDERLPQAVQVGATLERDGYAVLYEGDEGSNLLSVYLTAGGFAARAPDWTLLDVVPSDASATGQAWAIFRRR